MAYHHEMVFGSLRQPWLVALLLLTVLHAVPARAAEKAGVRMADTMTVRGQTLVLNGLGVREATIFNVDVYVAGLYLRQRTSDPGVVLRSDEPKVMHLAFVHDVDRAKISDAWSEGFEKNAGAKLASLRDRVQQLKNIMVDLRPGSTLTFAYTPEQQGVQVTVNGVDKALISGQDFAEVLFAIWLGASPPNRGLKKGLLGQ